MKKIQAIVTFLMFALMGYSASLHAEDIDIYVDNATNVGVPNVLFVIDNGADFDASANIGCSAYSDGTNGVPSLGTGKTSGVLQCALVNAISSLSNSTVNIGIMVSNANNYAETQKTTDITKGGYHELCASGGLGGCLLRKLTLMDSSGKTNMVTFIKGWALSGQSTADSLVFKVNSSLQASTMQEAWAYYNGKTGLSGTNYSTSILASGCQRNFVVYISNTQKNPSTAEYNTAKTALTSANSGTSVSEITGTIKFNPSVCSTTSSYTLAAGNNLADEWARLMYQQDGGASGNQGTQNIITYTIGIQSSGNQCSTDTYGMIASMAKNGQGKFFNTSSVTDLTNALNQILNEVQAVNSVFSSASLPVSVNAEGSYLNQIFLGMFRPDANGNPRWMGNLKQYQLIKNTSSVLVLGDALGNSAISSAGTGFISPTAQSFWTYKNTATAPDDATTGGFWVNNPMGTPPSTYDLADGEVVEKGGVAQQLRKENLKDDYTTTEGTSTNPRRLYTICPSGTCTSNNLTDSSNAFTTSNSGISASAFGSSTTLPITQITRSNGATTATVTTTGSHGLSAGTSVTISGSSESSYNGTFTVQSPVGTNTFTIGSFTETPPAATTVSYTISPTSVNTPVSVTAMSRATSTSGGKTTELVTVTTSSAHGLVAGTDKVTIAGATPTTYNNTWTVNSVPDSTHFTFYVTVSPSASLGGLSASLNSTSWPTITGASFTNPSQGTIVVTKSGMTVWVGEKVTLTSNTNGSKYNGTYSIASVNSAANSFTITTASSSVKSQGSQTGSVAPSTTAQAISVSRVATTDSATATATGATSGAFGNANGDTRTGVDITGAGTSDTAYNLSKGTITCINAGCTSFTYGIAVTPSSTITGSSITATKYSATGAITVGAGAITHSGTTATICATGNTSTGCPLTSNNFTNGQSVQIFAASGSAPTSESAYVGTWTLSCTAPCNSATLSPITVTPLLSVTNSGMSLYAGSSPPDKTTLIRWIRGEDNYGDELSPGKSGITVRPSIHGDVLHSRPLVLNYGDTRGIVVFYGGNDGIFRAVNGNQTASITSGSTTIPAGDEIWGLLLPEHFSQYNRLRINSPQVKYPSTTLASATTKDYFVDGPTGVYQKLAADNTVSEAYIYLAERRGGNSIYALDVSTPTSPVYKWTLDSSSTDFTEMGQTWSRPKFTLVQSATYKTTPVIVFGAGYDPNEDTEPPSKDTQGRGIYIVNAKTGALIWSANSSCTTSSKCLNVPDMKYAVPGDIAFVDRDGDGYTDKMYFADLGGQVWRADVTDSDTANWKITKIGAVGCNAASATDTGICASGTTPRKFFFPPSVLPVGSGGASGSFDLISVASGDREHPLKDTATGSAYNVTNRFYTFVDTGTSLGTPATHDLTEFTLQNVTSADTWDSTNYPNGFRITLGTGEKAVNAPTAVNGFIFFATNKPASQDSSCIANLGIATAYAVSPFLGTTTTNTLQGGGLPPSAVSGVILITTTNADGSTTTTPEKFCIGCGVSGLDASTGKSAGGSGGGGDCGSSIGPCKPVDSIPKQLKRTYWYRK